jgi:hypothetical protein
VNQEEMLVKGERKRVFGFEGRSAGAGVCECRVIIAISLMVSLSGWAGVK